MNRIVKRTFLVALVSLTLPVMASAQACGDQAGFDACVAEAEATCSASFPACERAPLTVEELRAALEEKCPCDKAKNYGKYRSCVSQLVNSLRTFKLVDQDTLALIKSDNETCKAAIKERKKNKGKSGDDHGKSDDKRGKSGDDSQK